MVRTSKRRYKTQKVTRKSIVKVVKQQLDKAIEDKYSDDFLSNIWGSIGQSWIEKDVTAIVQGTTGSTRIGRRIRVKSLRIYGVISQGSNETLADDPWNIVRGVVGVYAGNGGLTPLLTNTVSLASVLRKQTCQPLISKYMDKYIPLQVISTEQGAGDGYTPQLKMFNFYKSFKNLYITYAADGATITPDKRLMISFASDSSVITNPGFLTGYYTLTYEDA